MQNATGKRLFGDAALSDRNFAGPLGLPIGSQTYPHRQRIKDGDFAGLCRDLAELGVRDLERCAPDYEEFAGLTDGKQVRNVLDDHGLKSSSGHFGMNILRTRQQEMIAWAKEIGMTQMCTATLAGPMENGITTMDAVGKGSRRIQQDRRRGRRRVSNRCCMTRALSCQGSKATAG